MENYNSCMSRVSGEGRERANSMRCGEGAEEIYLVQLIVKYTEEFPCHTKEFMHLNHFELDVINISLLERSHSSVKDEAWMGFRIETLVL